MRVLKFLPVILALSVQLCPARSIPDLVESATRAIDTGLWDVAVLKLEQALQAKNLKVADQSQILILLAESLVRGNQPERALTILEESAVRKHPDAAFWNGQALAEKGSYAPAIAALLPIAMDTSHHFQREAVLTASSLQLSLSKSDDALATLALLESSKDLTVVVQAKLKRIEILLNLGRLAEARELLPATNEIPEPLAPQALFLEASLALAENRPTEAELIFDGLIENPLGQSLIRYDRAAIGRADAIAAGKSPDEATLSLLEFIQANPEAPLLDGMFRRIIGWFPAKILSAAHPTLVRLSEWLPDTSPPGAGLINTSPVSALAAFPSANQEIPDLAVFAMFAKAEGLYRIDTPAAKSEAMRLLQHIPLLAPQHFLSPRCRLTLAKWKIAETQSECAFTILDALQFTAEAAPVKGEAVFLKAGILFENGDSTGAAELFDEAAILLEGENREAAMLNAGLARLRQDPTATILIQSEDPAIAVKLDADLALEKALLSPTAAEAKSALDAFLTAHPGHPRAAEARIAIIEAALAMIPPDLSLAKAQIDTLGTAVSKLPMDQRARLALVRLRLADLSHETEQAILLAKEIISAFPETPTAPEAALILGKTLFQSGQYNEARIVLEKLATQDPGTQRSQAALLLAARSAALGATAQSRDEALALFDKTIAINGPLKSLAILEKARLNIDLNRLPIAVESLSTAYKTTPPDDPSRLPTGLLLAEAIYAQGDTNPESLADALQIYNELIGLTASNPAQFFRLQYLRGLTLEKLPDAEDLTKTRLGDALSAYFSVLDRPTEPPPPEWEWFERSGFRALALLENAKRWQAAVAIAEKIASFKGPRAEEASTRARQLRLKHMIWED